MAHALATDVASRLGRTLTDEETALVDVRLDDVERRIRRRILDLDAQITAGTIDVDDVKQVEADVVLRLVRNPEGYASETDGTYAYTFSRELASGQLEILPSDWNVLGVRTGGIFAIVPTVNRPRRCVFGAAG